MPHLSGRPDQPLRGFILSQLLGAGSLALAIWWTLNELTASLVNNKVTAALFFGQVLGPVLSQRLLEFAIALLIVHLAFGLLAFALARLTLAAAPQRLAGCQARLVLGWFLGLAALAWLANASWYPGSRFAPDAAWLSREWHGWRWVHLPLLLSAVLTAALALWCLRPRRRVAGHLPWLAVALAAAWTGGSLQFRDSAASRPAPRFEAPHVVILGLDSLRDDLAGSQSGPRLTPNIDAFLNGAHRFSDAISPLARTYPALVSILTGRHPVATHARFNLMPRARVAEGDTLADALRRSGYQTIYATDEARFANLDESFGFDQLITPPVGASDFLLGKAGDLPLVNLLSGTALGGALFPTSHANRAVAVTYRPRHFVARLEQEIAVDRPTFLMIHLTLSHWPYSWAGLRNPTTPQEYRPAYTRAVAELDRQFAEVTRLLETKGVLDNAIVVVLSDHGEALGWPGDSMLRKTGTAHEIWNSLWGHGTSVMSPHQYSVFLAMRGFGRTATPGNPGNHAWPVSLEDVRPTLQQIATGAVPADVTGISLLPLLDGTLDSASLAGRIRFTETDFNTPMVLAGKYNASGLIHEGAAYYEIMPASGWMQLKAERLPELMFRKERAAISRDSLLAAIPSGEGGGRVVPVHRPTVPAATAPGGAARPGGRARSRAALGCPARTVCRRAFACPGHAASVTGITRVGAGLWEHPGRFNNCRRPLMGFIICRRGPWTSRTN